MGWTRTAGEPSGNHHASLHPATNGRWHAKWKLSWNTQYTFFMHVFGATSSLYAESVALTDKKFLRRSSVGSLLNVRCWLGTGSNNLWTISKFSFSCRMGKYKLLLGQSGSCSIPTDPLFNLNGTKNLSLKELCGEAFEQPGSVALYDLEVLMYLSAGSL